MIVQRYAVLIEKRIYMVKTPFQRENPYMKDVFALYIIEDVQKNEASVNMIAQRRH